MNVVDNYFLTQSRYKFKCNEGNNWIQAYTDVVCYESVRKQKKQLKHDLNSAALFQLRY